MYLVHVECWLRQVPNHRVDVVMRLCIALSSNHDWLMLMLLWKLLSHQQYFNCCGIIITLVAFRLSRHLVLDINLHVWFQRSNMLYHHFASARQLRWVGSQFIRYEQRRDQSTFYLPCKMWKPSVPNSSHVTVKHFESAFAKQIELSFFLILISFWSRSRRDGYKIESQGISHVK